MLEKIITITILTLSWVEVLWGYAQLYGVLSSKHSLFVTTGSFFNPGPFAGFLAMALPLCVFCGLRLRCNRKVWGCLCLVFAVLIIGILPATRSRAAWIAGIIGLVYIAMVLYGSNICQFIKGKKWTIAAGLIVILCIFWRGYQLKKDSADGRLLIWKVSLIAIKDKPLTGYGTGRFSFAYGEAQETYFEDAVRPIHEQVIADMPRYAFNEYIQAMVEWGIPVVLLIISALVIILINGHKHEHYGLCSSLLSLLVFAFFSYPRQFLLFRWCFALLIIPCVSDACSNRQRIAVQVLSFSLLLLVLSDTFSVYRQVESAKQWGKVRYLYNSNDYASVVEEYKKISESMEWNDDFLFEYGRALSKEAKYKESNKTLSTLAQRNGDYMTLILIGKNYIEMGNYTKAEMLFTKAANRMPQRLYPLYQLAKLYSNVNYNRTIRLNDAIDKALCIKPKVESVAVEQMRKELIKIKSNMTKICKEKYS